MGESFLCCFDLARAIIESEHCKSLTCLLERELGTLDNHFDILSPDAHAFREYLQDLISEVKEG
jgi:hypothetical protein